MQLEQKINEFLAQIGSGREFEIRFGTFVYNRDTKQSNFDASVDINFWFRLKRYLDSILPVQQIQTRESTYENKFGSSSIRRIETENAENVYLLKSRLKIFNNYDYNLRLALSSEQIKQKEQLKNINWDSPRIVRQKNRFTYLIENCGKIDLTIVSEASEISKYELEFEIDTANIRLVMDYLTVIMKIRQDNYYIISEPDRRQVFKNYRDLTRVNYFVGAQPETIRKDQLSILFRELYSVTDKADGERFFLFIDDLGQVFFIDNNIQAILKTNLESVEFKNCILDGELVRHPDSINFHAFDILFVNGNDLRDNQEFLFKQRLDILNTVITTIITPENSPKLYNVFIKKFIFRNVFMGSEIIMDEIKNKNYLNDGLIFTPMNEPYPKSKRWNKLFKWKPVEMNTLDFFAKKIETVNGTGTWELYIQAPREQRDREREPREPRDNTPVLTLFDVSKVCPDLPAPVDTLTFKTTFPDSLLDPSTGNQFQTNTVIEFKWDPLVSKFIPMRTRWDKTVVPSKHGNFVHVACSVWNAITNPVTEQILFSGVLNNNSTPQIGGDEKSFFFEELIPEKWGETLSEILCHYNTNTTTEQNVTVLHPGKLKIRCNGNVSKINDLNGNLKANNCCLLSDNIYNYFENEKLIKNFFEFIAKTKKVIFVFFDYQDLENKAIVSNNIVQYYCKDGIKNGVNCKKIYIKGVTEREENFITVYPELSLEKLLINAEKYLSIKNIESGTITTQNTDHIKLTFCTFDICTVKQIEQVETHVITLQEKVKFSPPLNFTKLEIPINTVSDLLVLLNSSGKSTYFTHPEPESQFQRKHLIELFGNENELTFGSKSCSFRIVFESSNETEGETCKVIFTKEIPKEKLEENLEEIPKEKFEEKFEEKLEEIPKEKFEEPADLAKKTLIELKELCRKYKLKKSGNKADLISRINNM